MRVSWADQLHATHGSRERRASARVVRLNTSSLGRVDGRVDGGLGRGGGGGSHRRGSGSVEARRRHKGTVDLGRSEREEDEGSDHGYLR